MEKIFIPKVSCIFEQFQRIDKYKWHAANLVHYMVDHFAMKGISAPIVIGAEMSKMQEQDNFGVTNMKDFLIPLCNTAFLLNRQFQSHGEEYKPKFKATFSENCKKNLKSQQKHIKSLISEHELQIEELRNIQKECWRLQEIYRQRKSNLDNFFYHLQSQDVPDNLMPQYIEMKAKLDNAAERYSKSKEKFRETLEKEEKLKTYIIKKIEEIKQTLVPLMREGLGEGYNDLRKVIDESKGRQGFDEVKKQLRKFDVDKTVEKLLQLTSATYKTPSQRDFIKAAHNNDKVFKPYYKRCEFKEFGYDKDSLFKGINKVKAGFPHEAADDDCYEDCFFPRTGGFYLPTKEKGIPKGPGTMDVKKGYQLKLKLSLMNGTIGFGWRRKNKQGTKKWGFFHMSVEDTTKSAQLPKQKEETTSKQTQFTEQNVKCDTSLFLASKYKTALKEKSGSKLMKNEDNKIENDLVIEEI